MNLNGSIEDVALIPQAKNQLLKTLWKKLRAAGVNVGSINIEQPVDDSTELAREKAYIEFTMSENLAFVAENKPKLNDD